MEDRVTATISAPTVLISDDDRLLVSSLDRYLRSQGVEVIADLTSDVVELARAHHPMLIILDLAQCVDGRALLARLKQDAKTRDIDVFVVTGNSDPFVRARCFQLGALDYFTKPTDDRFYGRINEYLARAMRQQN